ncbi:MAG TPA: hypothetical protein ENN69_05855, partial [Spirochaetia bacterium]|nr:hypothetical protein [Spirochaetia bacterium]
MALQSATFVNERKESWEKLSTIVRKVKRGGVRRLSADECREFPNLYRKASTDAATAKTLRLSPDTVEYINDLAQQAHTILYTGPKKNLRRIIRFFTRDFPEAFRKNLLPIAVIFFLFFGTGIIAFIAVAQHPEHASALLPSDTIDQVKEAFSEKPERAGHQNIMMAGFY